MSLVHQSSGRSTFRVIYQVAQISGISTSWLYGDDDLRRRIMHLRVQQKPKVQIQIPKQEHEWLIFLDTWHELSPVRMPHTEA
ncbi:MAG: hypothetical protein ACJ795_12775 [Ktedonobacteraceae bacterium]